ncbi:triphosphoribosyl-dephospho-CoA synthase CitG [Hathewaya limosa]|uniref:Probable 2-(5''-triphosphoribosyl)-3'-dephosphocoenzyme-A synthase n=2 Tax=Hathewaya limosa TaxID=1536 RepID=A0ABU0JSK0_HATLI|nr:triphosphoribosyl-dephospho-CoA synthase CitG [Hathewaya limosa]
MMNAVEYKAEDILIAREQRVELQEKLMQQYNGNIVVMRVNYPGLKKYNKISISIIKVMYREIVRLLRQNNVELIHEELIGNVKEYNDINKIIRNEAVCIEDKNLAEGPIVIFVCNENPLKLKKITTKLEEEHILGRCLDIDVYNESGNSISRRELGYGFRKCFLCNDIAHVCVRTKRHTENEVINFIKNSYKKYMLYEKGELGKMEITNKLGEFALQSMLYEISAYPSPGLVSPISSGAHKDMDFYTFLSSIAAINPYMCKFVEAGYSNKSYKEIFDDIRRIGIDAEKKMLKKTCDINTHKGMIFLMGVSLAATSKAIHDNKPFSEIRQVIKDMTSGIVENELLNIKDQEKITYGERLFAQYGIEGIRGEVERGLPIVFDKALKFYNQHEYLQDRERLIQTLIYIMCFCEDTTILHRHPLPRLREVQVAAEAVLELGGVETIEGRDALEKLDLRFSREGLSPGGVADLLAITVYFSLVEEFMKNEEFYE